VLGMLMMNLYCMGMVPIVWAVVAFTLAFGDLGNEGWIGNFEFFGLTDVGQVLPSSYTDFGIVGIPFVLFVAYQLTFAVITPALMSGAVADRIKFSAWAVLVPVWLVLVYAPIAHWVFGGGWIFDLGALDFAGGAVVHMNAGAGALALVILLGKRRGWPSDAMPPHNLTMTMVGTGVLWFGWFGFNAGSALGANAVAASAFMNTFLAAAAAMIGWLIVEMVKDGKPTTLGACSGAVAGLVAITPCAGFVGGMAPIYIGLIAGAVCFLGIQLKYRFGYDDSLDVVGVHLIGGLVGTLLLGFFADTSINELGYDGVFFGGGTDLLIDQVIAAAVTIAFSFVVTLIIAKAIDATIGLRVSEEDELQGLDLSQHSETGYNLADFG
jgi:Amt family ammonium transporter